MRSPSLVKETNVNAGLHSKIQFAYFTRLSSPTSRIITMFQGENHAYTTLLLQVLSRPLLQRHNLGQNPPTFLHICSKPNLLQPLHHDPNIGYNMFEKYTRYDVKGRFWV